MVKVEKKFSIQDGLKISLLAETQVGFQYKAGRVSSVTDLAAFTQSHSPHSRDFRVRRNQAFEPCQVYLPFGTLEEENLKTESLLPSQQSMTFPKKAQIPHWSGNQCPSSYGQKEHQKHTAAARLFHYFTLGLHSLVFHHFSFPTASGSNSGLLSTARSRFCASITLATQSISLHPEHCCKYPRNSHPPSGQIKIDESKSRFS